jgi:hypothetical protein
MFLGVAVVIAEVSHGAHDVVLGEGQELQPSEVKSSTTAGRCCARRPPDMNERPRRYKLQR